jgi:WD40 repeat protein
LECPERGDVEDWSILRTSIEILDAQTLQPTVTLAGSACVVNSISFNVDGSQLAAMDSHIFIWDTQSGEIVGEEPLMFITRRVLDWSHINNLIVSDNIIMILDPETLDSIGSYHPEDRYNDIATVEWDPNSSVFAFSTWSGFVGLYDQETGTKTDVTVSNDAGRKISWSGEGDSFAVLNVADEVTIWDATTQANTVSFLVPNVQDIDWNPLHHALATGGIDGTIRIWDTQTGQEITSFNANQSVYALDWSPDGRKLAVGGNPGEIQVLPVSIFDVSPTPCLP